MGARARLPSRARHARIVEMLRATGSVSVTQAAADLGVSDMTLRRDLLELESEGKLTRVHGGAVAAPALRAPDAIDEPSFDSRMAERSEAKMRIASRGRIVGRRLSLACDRCRHHHLSDGQGDAAEREHESVHQQPARRGRSRGGALRGLFRGRARARRRACGRRTFGDRSVRLPLVRRRGDRRFRPDGRRIFDIPSRTANSNKSISNARPSRSSSAIPRRRDGNRWSRFAPSTRSRF